MSIIREGESGFRFIMESDFDATGVVSREIRIKQPGVAAALVKVATALTTDAAGDFFYTAAAADFAERGMYSAQLILDFGGGKKLKGRTEEFRVGESL